MLFLRSLIFNILWYPNLLLQMVLQSPFYFFLSHEQALKVPKRWAHTTHWLHKWIIGTRYEIEGFEHLPKEGCIVASKHQSLWDFYAVNAMLPDGAFVLKSELMKIPFFGWYIAKLNHIPIRRAERGVALKRMTADAKVEIAKGRQILIFPEGTRTVPGAEPKYRYGVTRLYLELNCPVVPLAVSSGLYWPRRKFIRYPGVIRAKFMEPIMPGLSAEEFTKEMERRIEQGCDELYWRSAQDDVPPPLSDPVKERIMAHAERLVEKGETRN